MNRVALSKHCPLADKLALDIALKTLVVEFNTHPDDVLKHATKFLTTFVRAVHNPNPNGGEINDE